MLSVTQTTLSFFIKSNISHVFTPSLGVFEPTIFFACVGMSHFLLYASHICCMEISLPNVEIYPFHLCHLICLQKKFEHTTEHDNEDVNTFASCLLFPLVFRFGHFELTTVVGVSYSVD